MITTKLSRPHPSETLAKAELGRLIVQCADRPGGIIAAISAFLAKHEANIVESDQSTTDPESGHFFLRMVFHRKDLAGTWTK